MDKSEYEEYVKMLEEDVLPVLENVFGMDFDYSEKSIKKLDQTLKQKYQNTNFGLHYMMSDFINLYLIETINRLIPGFTIDSVVNTKDSEGSRIEVGLGTPEKYNNIYPSFAVKDMVSKNGSTYGLYDLYLLTKIIHSDKLNEHIKQAEYGKVIELPNGKTLELYDDSDIL